MACPACVVYYSAEYRTEDTSLIAGAVARQASRSKRGCRASSVWDARDGAEGLRTHPAAREAQLTWTAGCVRDWRDLHNSSDPPACSSPTLHSTPPSSPRLAHALLLLPTHTHTHTHINRQHPPHTWTLTTTANTITFSRPFSLWTCSLRIYRQSSSDRPADVTIAHRQLISIPPVRVHQNTSRLATHGTQATPSPLYQHHHQNAFQTGTLAVTR